MRLAVANARLEADVGARVAEVPRRAAGWSRPPTSSAGAWRRTARRGGARASSAAAIVAGVQGAGALALELEQARDELRRFAHGIHPTLLTERGLAAALEDVAARMPIPVVLEVADGRYGARVEITAFFVCTEALANAVKHAAATSVHVRIASDGRTLRAEVADDGAGGAAIDADGGLQGLADRVAALDGTFSVDSPPGAGTRVAAVLPL